MKTNITNAEYIELVEGVVSELRPDQPVKVQVMKVTDPRTQRQSEKLAICLDVFRGPTTQVLFNFADVLGLGELPLQSFIVSKLTSIGVHPAEARKRSTARVTDEVKKDATAAEAAKLRELLAKRKESAVAPAVKAAESLQVAEDGGFFGSNPDADGDVKLGEKDNA